MKKLLPFLITSALVTWLYLYLQPSTIETSSHDPQGVAETHKNEVEQHRRETSRPIQLAAQLSGTLQGPLFPDDGIELELRHNGKTLYKTRSNDTHHFKFQDILPDTYRLHLNTPGYLFTEEDQAKRHIQLKPGAHPILKLTLEKGRIINIHVENEENRLIRNAEVAELNTPNDWVKLASGKTTWTFNGLNLSLTARASGYQAASVTFYAPNEDIRIKLKRGRQLKGQVVDQDGPVAEVKIYKGREILAQSDHDGFFQIGELPPGRILQIRFAHHAYHTRFLIIGPDDPEDLRIELKKHGNSPLNLRIKVTDAEDSPIPNVPIRHLLDVITGKETQEVFSKKTNQHGELHIDEFEPSKGGEIQIDHPDYQYKAYRVSPERFHSQDNTYLLEVQLEKGNLSTGKVLGRIPEKLHSEERVPVPNASIFLSRHSKTKPIATTDQDGTFTARNLPRFGGYQVLAKGYAPLYIFGRFSKDNPHFIMTPQGLTRFTFQDASNGRPLTSLRAIISRSGRFKNQKETLTITGSNFNYNQIGIEEEQTIRFEKEGFDPITLRVTGSKPAHAETHIVKFKQARLITGHVVDPSGTPIPKLHVNLLQYTTSRADFDWQSFLTGRSDSSVIVRTRTTDSQGRFSFKGYADEERYDLVVYGYGYASKHRPHIQNDGDLDNIKVVTDASVRIVGSINRELYPYARNISISASNYWVPDIRLYPEDDSYELDNLPSGKYSLTLIGQSESGGLEILKTRRTNLEPGDEQRLDFGYDPKFKVSGIATQNKQPIQQGTIFLVKGNDWKVSNLRQGHFLFEEIPPGEWSLVYPWVDDPGQRQEYHLLKKYPNRVEILVEDRDISGTYHFDRYGNLMGSIINPTENMLLIIRGTLDSGESWTQASPLQQNKFIFPGLPVGTFDLGWRDLSQGDDFFPLLKTFRMDYEDLDLGQLSPGGAQLRVTIQGPSDLKSKPVLRLIDLETGSLIARRSIQQIPSTIWIEHVPSISTRLMLELPQPNSFDPSPAEHLIQLPEGGQGTATFELIKKN